MRYNLYSLPSKPKQSRWHYMFQKEDQGGLARCKEGSFLKIKKKVRVFNFLRNFTECAFWSGFLPTVTVKYHVSELSQPP